MDIDMNALRSLEREKDISFEKVVDAIGALYRDLGIGVETVKRQAASYT